MQEQEYRSAPGISHSLLREIAKSPSHFLHRRDNPVEETEAMLLGTLIHAMVLEPRQVELRYARAVDADRRTKAGKEAWAAQQAEIGTRRLIPAGTWDLACRVAEAVDRDAQSSLWIDEAREGAIERPLFWTRQGIACKGRPDSVLKDGTVLDIKTTRSAIPGFFRNELFRRYYHTQGAFYRSGVLADGGRWRAHVLVVVEVEPPYPVGVYRLKDEVIDDADEVVTRWINLYRDCESSGQWPGYGLVDVSTPNWALVEAG